MAATTTFKCPYCYQRDENLEEPKLLPCGHVECTKCLHKGLKLHGRLTCAKCFHTLNSRLSDLPSAARGTSKGRHELCDKCYDQPAISYCEHRSCKKLLCRRHKESHRVIHPDHHTVSLQEQELHSQPQKHSKRSCPPHDDTTVVSGCKRCREVFCRECDLSSGCGGHPHKEIGLKDLAKEVKNDISLLKAKAERRKSELDELFREADRVLSNHVTETEDLLMLLDRTRDEQLKEISSMYSALKSEVVRRRNSTEDEIKEFQKEAVAEELSRLNSILHTIQLRLSARQLVDLVRNSRETEAEIESTVCRKLPSLKVPAGVRLDIKKQSVINAVIEESKGSILVQIGSAAQPELSKLSAEASIKAKHTTASVPLAEDEEEISQQSETWKQRSYEQTEAEEEISQQSETWKQRTYGQTEVEDEFDKIYYEFLKIIRVREFKAKVLGKYDGEIVESEKISDPKFLMVKTKSSVPGEARKMMDALLDLSYDVTRSAHSHTIKLRYDGDKEKLSKALIDDLQDPSFGFIARLVTNEDIRIIGSLANMDRDIHTLESYIYDYKKRNPAQTVTEKRQVDIKLSNGTLVSIVEGDLTKMKFDAVVSSSSIDLSHQYGVSRAIALACGQRFQTQGKQLVDRQGLFREGETWVQPADGDLARIGVSYVIHAIAPLPEKGRDVSPLLVKTISNTLNEVETLKCRTVAFPAICAGIMGVPISTCADCYWTALENFSSLHPRAHLQHIRFVVNDAGFVVDLYNAMYNLFMGGKANILSQPYLLEIPGAAAYPGAAARVTSNSSSATANHRYSPTSPLDKSYKDYGYNNTTGSANDSSYELSPVHQVRSDRHRSTSISAKRSSVAGATGSSQYKATTRASSSVTKSMLSRNECPICLDELKDYETLPCTHRFCKGCIKQLIETTKTNQCPTCRKPFRTAEGKQPKGGRMSTTRSPLSLPGYEKHGSIVITYDIPGGVQGPEHPHPGKRYQGTNRKAFLPDNVKGRKAAKLLKKAFDQRLVFTVGQSVTTGQDDCVVWNDIHHKTSMRGGPSNYGYPDSDYLTRLIDDLKARGIAD